MKILALYLPQYHEIKENSLWWGEGYTEWTAVKRAKSLYKRHIQPRKPINNNYYDLSEENAKTLKWQAELANQYGVYGFCFYHYWFKGKQLLEKPMEILLQHPEINTQYCICWANESWTRTWYGLEKEMLMLQDYGDETDWKNHFEYLLKFFRDPRYIKVDNKPLVNIYRSTDIDNLQDMLSCWRSLAKLYGFDDIYVVVSNTALEKETRSDLIDAYYDFEPGYSTKNNRNPIDAFLYNSRILLITTINKIFNTAFLERKVDIRLIYKRICKRCMIRTENGKPKYPGIFPMWDNTPRRDYKGMVYTNDLPELFYDTLKKIKQNIAKDDFVYLNAWNEWGEGCYLEPDEHNKYQYLEAIKKVLD